MKRREDGYILVYVLVMIVFLCALAAAICSVALNNYQAQQASVERTQQLYQAEGQIERFVAAIQAQTAALSSTEEVYGSEQLAKDAVRAAFQSVLEHAVPPVEEKQQFVLGDVTWEGDGGESRCTFSVDAVTENAAVTAQLQVKLTVGAAQAVGPEGTGYSCRVEECEIVYESYTVSYGELEADGSG